MFSEVELIQSKIQNFNQTLDYAMLYRKVWYQC